MLCCWKVINKFIIIIIISVIIIINGDIGENNGYICNEWDM